MNDLYLLRKPLLYGPFHWGHPYQTHQALCLLYHHITLAVSQNKYKWSANECLQLVTFKVMLHEKEKSIKSSSCYQILFCKILSIPWDKLWVDQNQNMAYSQIELQFSM